MRLMLHDSILVYKEGKIHLHAESDGTIIQ